MGRQITPRRGQVYVLGLIFMAGVGAVRQAVHTAANTVLPCRLRRLWGVRSLLRRLQPQRQKKVDVLLRGLASLRASVKFVQIGANDGRLDDSLRDVVMAYAWHGVLVLSLIHI